MGSEGRSCFARNELSGLALGFLSEASDPVDDAAVEGIILVYLRAEGRDIRELS